MQLLHALNDRGLGGKMYDWVVLWEWIEIATRWTHVITAIAWIGSSFYFIALDLGLRQTPSLPPLAHGEEWQVHGGWFLSRTKISGSPRHDARAFDLV